LTAETTHETPIVDIQSMKAINQMITTPLQAWCQPAPASVVVVRSAHTVLASSVFVDAITRKVGAKLGPSGFKRGSS